MNGTKYTAEHKAYVRDNIKKMTSLELTAAFNEKFGLSISTTAMRGNFARWGLKTGRDTRLKKGCEPFNKGTVGIMKANRGSFKKGHNEENYLPVGSERIRADGYTYAKTAMPNTWQEKHRIIYGDIPEGFVVIFKDGNRTNFDPENLEAIPRNESFNLNKNGYSTAHEELKPLIRAVAKIETEYQKKNRDRRS
jgi:hypothetical protein